MKRMPLLLVVAAIAFGVAGAATADFTPPTDAQIDELLADTGKLSSMIAGATPQQTADVLIKAIAKIEASTELTDDQKKQAIAVPIAKATALTGPKAPEVIALVAAGSSETALPIIVAAATVAVRDRGGAILNAVVAKLGADSPGAAAARSAAADPGAVLGTALLRLVRQAAAGGAGVSGSGTGGGPLRTPVRRYPGQQ